MTWGGTFENVATVSVKDNGQKNDINFSAQIEDIILSYDLNIKAINDGNTLVSYPAGFEDVNESTKHLQGLIQNHVIKI